MSAVTALAPFVPEDQLLHLARRATFGLTPKVVTQIKALGASAWLEQQLNPSSIDDGPLESMIASRFPRLSWSIAQARNGGIEEFGWSLMFDVGFATLARQCWTTRQLYEVMVDFWSNHLNVTCPSDDVWANRHDYDREVIRKHALGSFRDMLVASATHPAMMYYLNNAESTKTDPNENYGRELLELHSVGVDGGYDEEDMRQSTLAMTGFSVDWNTDQFRYRPSYHHVGPLSVMGWSHPNSTADGGYEAGLSYVRYLAHHPSTALYLARKLVRRFISDDPQPGLEAALAQTYLANDTAIVPVLRQLFMSAEFAGSIGQKIRRPSEDLVATIRTLDIKWDASGTQGMRGLYWMSEELGQVPLTWSQPDGYPDFAAAWASAGGMIGRWNCHISLAAHWWPKALILPPLRKLLPTTLPTTYGAYVDQLAQRLVYGPLAPAHRAAVLAFLDRSAGARLYKTDAALKWRFPYVVALILDSPYHLVR